MPKIVKGGPNWPSNKQKTIDRFIRMNKANGNGVGQWKMNGQNDKLKDRKKEHSEEKKNKFVRTKMSLNEETKVVYCQLFAGI